MSINEIGNRLLIVGFISLGISFAWVYLVQADQPHRESCECRELTRIRMLLEHRFGVICDERHCEAGSSSSSGGELP